jgi:membrane protein DedA with SNARE-associated domain
LIDFLYSNLQDFWFLLIYIWSILEGETVILVSSSLIQEGKVELWIVVISAVFGGFSGDFLWYLLGKGNKEFVNKKFKKRDIARTKLLFRKYGFWIIIFLRFLYGMRAVLPAIIGASGYNIKKYIFLDMISSILWVTFYLFLGYFFFEWLNSYLKEVQLWIFFIAFVILAIIGVKLWKQP